MNVDYAVGFPNPKNSKIIGKIIRNHMTLKDANEYFDKLLPKYKKKSKIFKYIVPKGKKEFEGRYEVV